MSNPYFQFKQFTVWHDRCAMKVGTDGALLGAWTDVAGAGRILDVGTGTGLVTLMLAQRSVDASIVAVEIDEAAAVQAHENVSNSPWANRITVLHSDYKALEVEEGFDLIVSNPPYFVDSLQSPDRQRSLARHASDLTYAELLSKSVSLLRPGGRLALVLPMDSLSEICRLAPYFKLQLCRQTDVRTTVKATPKRVLVCLTLGDCTFCHDELVIQEAPQTYTPQFVALLKDYYLKL